MSRKSFRAWRTLPMPQGEIFFWFSVCCGGTPIVRIGYRGGNRIVESGFPMKWKILSAKMALEPSAANTRYRVCIHEIPAVCVHMQQGYCYHNDTFTTTLSFSSCASTSTSWKRPNERSSRNKPRACADSSGCAGSSGFMRFTICGTSGRNK